MFKRPPEGGGFYSQRWDNKKLLKKKIDIEGLSGKEELILNKEIDAKYFDKLDEEKIEYNENFFACLSEEDKERAFKNIIKHSIQNFAPKRSVKIVANALYKWFKKYTGVDMFDLGVIYVQNIVLNNAEEFSNLIDKAVTKYKPVKEEEKKKKIKENETWNGEWEISESRNYNPNTYKPYGFNLSLYKHIKDKKAYLNFDNDVEKSFLAFLEKHKDKILWWWQNGNEHMALNFGIKYGIGSTFQPDFIVKFKDGKLGIYDTKAGGFQERDNKIKAEALQNYIKEENKKRDKDLLIGGIIIKQGEYFLINSDEIYTPFGCEIDGVKEKQVSYNNKGKNNGWQYLEF